MQEILIIISNRNQLIKNYKGRSLAYFGIKKKLDHKKRKFKLMIFLSMVHALDGFSKNKLNNYDILIYNYDILIFNFIKYIGNIFHYLYLFN